MTDTLSSAVPGACFCEAHLGDDGLLHGTFALPPQAAAGVYLANLAQGVETPIEVPPSRTFSDDCPDADWRPFLSVLMRTQGRRFEEMNEALLCLAAQHDTDFEVLVVGHKVAGEGLERVTRLLEWQPDHLRRRIRYLAVDTGGRTEPLQVGFAAARGRYVAIFDDDDVVFDTWVENFRELAAEHDGQVLFSYAVAQNWEVIPSSRDDADRHELRAAANVDPSYCHDWDAAAELSLNACPPVSLAFPAYAFQQLGIRFTDDLNTTEDWDYLMRVASVCGVATCRNASSIYRLWVNAESSHTVHGESEWQANYAHIVNSLNERPFLLDAGGVEDVRSKAGGSGLTSRVALERTARLVLFEKAYAKFYQVRPQIAFLHDNNLSRFEGRAVCCHQGDAEWDLVFDVDDPQPASTLVFTPMAVGHKVLGEFKMRITEANGMVSDLDFSNGSHNGYQVDCNHVVFLKDHPFVMFKFDAPKTIVRAAFSFELASSVSDAYVDQVTLGKAGLMIGRGKRWLDRKVRGDV